MIYLGTWRDGRQAIFRASDEEQARMRLAAWRDDEPLFDHDVPSDPLTIEQVVSKGPVGVVLAGWLPWIDAS